MLEKPVIPVSIGIFWDWREETSLKIWMQLREDSGELNGKWEFPGGKIEDGESTKEALVREVDEEVGIMISKKENVKMMKLYSHEFEKAKVLLHTFLINGEEQIRDNGKWFEFKDEKEVDKIAEALPPINREIIKDLLKYTESFKNQNMRELLWT